jgi:hypothetical protein
VPTHELTGEQASTAGTGRGGGRRRPPLDSVVALQRMVGNRAAAQLLQRAPVGQAPEGVDAGVALPTGATIPDARTVKVADGAVGSIDRVMLDGLPGSQGQGWDSGSADKDHLAVTGKGRRGHRGRAIALVPHGMKHDGPVSVVVHLHGMDVGGYKGSSGMRETGARPEDVRYFQIPQQLEAFTQKHPGARIVVLMPLGVTAGGMSKFGIGNFDAYLDAALSQLGFSGKDGTLYLSAHSGGGFTISALASDPSWRPDHYRFGGVFAFESFHAADMKAWNKLITGHLDADLKQLRSRRRTAAAQLEYLRSEGFHFAAFGGYGGYRDRVTTLGKTILDWFAGHRDELRDAVDDSRVLDLLWRNYQAVEEDAGHMEALSKSSHFESALESLVAAPPSGSSQAVDGRPGTQPAPQGPKPRTKTEHTHPASDVPAHADHKQQAHEEHKGEQPPSTAGKGSQPVQGTVAKHTKTSKAKSRSLQEPFQFAPYPLLDEAIVLIPGDDAQSAKYTKAKAKAEAKHKTLPTPGLKPDMTGIPSEFMPELLRRAQVPDPDGFFKKFVSGVSFLGRPINSPIHEHLAAHLRDVEQELAAQFGGPDKDPKVAGDALGLGAEAHAGARQASGTAAISMHMFGLAIDVNHYANPYLQAAGGMPDDVFLSISQLMQGKDGNIHLGASEEAAAAKYARLQAHNQMVIDYFALADPDKEQELKDKLAHASGPWKKRDVQKARAQIEQDLASLGHHTQRDSDLEMLRKHGYLQLREEVVRGMKMNWGAWYGDMMHFDMRTDGDIGQRISEQIVKYLAELRAQQRAAAKAAGKAKP